MSRFEPYIGEEVTSSAKMHGGKLRVWMAPDLGLISLEVDGGCNFTPQEVECIGNLLLDMAEDAMQDENFGKAELKT